MSLHFVHSFPEHLAWLFWWSETKVRTNDECAFCHSFCPDVNVIAFVCWVLHQTILEEIHRKRAHVKTTVSGIPYLIHKHRRHCNLAHWNKVPDFHIFTTCASRTHEGLLSSMWVSRVTEINSSHRITEESTQGFNESEETHRDVFGNSNLSWKVLCLPLKGENSQQEVFLSFTTQEYLFLCDILKVTESGKKVLKTCQKIGKLQFVLRWRRQVIRGNKTLNVAKICLGLGLMTFNYTVRNEHCTVSLCTDALPRGLRLLRGAEEGAEWEMNVFCVPGKRSVPGITDCWLIEHQNVRHKPQEMFFPKLHRLLMFFWSSFLERRRKRSIANNGNQSRIKSNLLIRKIPFGCA